MSKRPLLSIVIPTLNAAATLEDCLRSIGGERKKQAIECIAVDGGSADGTLEILEKYSGIIVRRISEPDLGIYDAMNKGVRMSRGRWIYFFGADDKLLPGFGQMLRRLRNPSTVYYGDTHWPKFSAIHGGPFTSRRLMDHNLCHQGVFYPRAVFEKYFFDLKYPVWADYEFNIRCWLDPDFKFQYVRAVVACFGGYGLSSRFPEDAVFRRDQAPWMQELMREEREKQRPLLQALQAHLAQPGRVLRKRVRRERRSDGKIKILLADWAGYEPYRKKEFRQGHTIDCGSGLILEQMEKHAAGLPFEVFLIVNEAQAAGKKEMYQALRCRHTFLRHVAFRDNTGLDFGAYNWGYRFLKKLGYEGDLVFMNSSVSGPLQEGWLARFRDLFYRHAGTGLCGITLNSQSLDGREFTPHVQSFFVYTTMRVLRHAHPQSLPGFEIRDDHHRVITEGEIVLSRKVLDQGYGLVSALFPDFFYRKKTPWTLPEGDLRYTPEFSRYANALGVL